MKIGIWLFNLCFTAFLLSGCELSDATRDEILDDLETDSSAQITYVNATRESMGFYVKNELFNRDVFNSDFRISNVPGLQSFGPEKFNWRARNRRTYFGVEDVATQDVKYSQVFEPKNNEKYWAIGTRLRGELNVDLIKKNSDRSAGEYRVRVYSNQQFLVINTHENEILFTTKAGESSEQFNLESCSDLKVGSAEVNLCQTATAGNAYLVVANSESEIVVLKEN